MVTKFESILLAFWYSNFEPLVVYSQTENFLTKKRKKRHNYRFLKAVWRITCYWTSASRPVYNFENVFSLFLTSKFVPLTQIKRDWWHGIFFKACEVGRSRWGCEFWRMRWSFNWVGVRTSRGGGLLKTVVGRSRAN